MEISGKVSVHFCTNLIEAEHKHDVLFSFFFFSFHSRGFFMHILLRVAQWATGGFSDKHFSAKISVDYSPTF